MIERSRPGVRRREAAYVRAFGEPYLNVPETIKIDLSGGSRPYPFGKDVALYTRRKYGDDFAQDKAIEFHSRFARVAGSRRGGRGGEAEDP